MEVPHPKEVLLVNLSKSKLLKLTTGLRKHQASIKDKASNPKLWEARLDSSLTSTEIAAFLLNHPLEVELAHPCSNLTNNRH